MHSTERDRVRDRERESERERARVRKRDDFVSRTQREFASESRGLAEACVFRQKGAFIHSNGAALHPIPARRLQDTSLIRKRYPLGPSAYGPTVVHGRVRVLMSKVSLYLWGSIRPGERSRALHRGAHES